MMLNKQRGFLAAAVIAGAALMAVLGLAHASSHREAPFITTAPKVDGTDFYMFRSYAPGRQDYVTLIANFIPLQEPYGGPNFYQFDQNALYEIHIDNNGDAKEDITFQFRFKNTSKHTTLNVGGKPVLIPLINSSTVSGKNSPSLNVRETYTIDMVKGDRRTGHRTRLAGTDGAAEFEKPVDNIGDKTFGGDRSLDQSQQRDPGGFVDHRRDLDRLAIDIDVHQERRRGHVIVPDFVMDELEVPFGLAGIQVHRHQAVAVKTIARALAAIKVRRRLFDRQISQIGHRVGSDLRPYTGVAGIFVGAVQPSLSAGLALLRNGAELPDALAGAHIEGARRTLVVLEA